MSIRSTGLRALALCAPRMIPRVWDQRRCKRWGREGAFETIEGVVTDYRWFATPTKADRTRTGTGPAPFLAMLTAVRFRVGRETFVLKQAPDRGGFRLSGMPDIDALAKAAGGYAPEAIAFVGESLRHAARLFGKYRL